MKPASSGLVLKCLLRLAPGCLLSAFALAPGAQAQTGAQAYGHAEAEVVVPIRAMPLTDLSFGAIVVGSAGEGAVRIAPDGSPPLYLNTARSSCSGEAECMPHRARFSVSGEPSKSYRVVLPQTLTAVGMRTGAGLPVVSLEMRSLNAPSATGEGLLDSAGRDSFFVGGTLQVPPGTRPDVFRAELPVIVAYN